MKNTFFAAIATVALFAAPTFAADTTVAGEVTAIAEAAGPAPAIIAAATPVWKPASRPTILPALYAGSALLQAYDAYSTLKALNLGAVEANPVAKGVVGNPAAAPYAEGDAVTELATAFEEHRDHLAEDVS